MVESNQGVKRQDSYYLSASYPPYKRAVYYFLTGMMSELPLRSGSYTITVVQSE